jgi:4a-hydroxytetrahydrobiopterin dehydratase
MVDRIAEQAERADHHPDLDLRYFSLTVTLQSHDVSGITRRDVRLARAISEIAAEVGAAAQPGSVQVVALAIDTADPDEIRGFWQATLGLKVDARSEGAVLYDPNGLTPSVYLQRTQPHDVPRQRFHIDVDVPPDAAEERIRRAVEAGGTPVSERHAPAWWTLADPQGNKVDIATWQGRD